MLHVIESVGKIWLEQLYSFAALVVLFTALARLSPAIKSQKVLRKEFRIDALYWFMMPLIITPLYLGLMAFIITLQFGGNEATIDVFLTQGRPLFHGWPIWLQCVVILLIGDVIQYYMHRLLHGRRLWRWHAIHHMAEELDWLSQARFHPVDTMIRSVTGMLVISAIGFAPAAFSYLVLFNVFYSSLVHANLDWHFGPLRFVLASPVFHRWHHTAPDVAGNMNFAPTFPFLDIIGGTFHMPMDDNPNHHAFGVKDPIPKDRFIAQLYWPLKF